jgi:hypothetical protein
LQLLEAAMFREAKSGLVGIKVPTWSDEQIDAICKVTHLY